MKAYFCCGKFSLLFFLILILFHLMIGTLQLHPSLRELNAWKKTFVKQAQSMTERAAAELQVSIGNVSVYVRACVRVDTRVWRVRACGYTREVRACCNIK